MLVPIILRKTKLKQKASPLHQHNASSIMDLRNNIFHKDLTLEPTQTLEEREQVRLEKLRSLAHASYAEKNVTGPNIVEIRAPEAAPAFI